MLPQRIRKHIAEFSSMMIGSEINAQKQPLGRSEVVTAAVWLSDIFI